MVAPYQQRVTSSGVILASTRRDGVILPSSFVINHSFNQLNDALSAALVGPGCRLTVKMTLGSDSFMGVNRP